MQKINRKHAIKRTVDIIMIVLLLLLMAYQVTGGAAHEWMGLAMAVLVIIHQILNLQWYRSLLKGKYPAARVAMNLTDIFLIIAFILTVYCGMSMSGYAVPFLHGMGKISFVRRTHLSVSYWLFVLMGIHLGFHIRAMFIKSQYSGKTQTAVSICFAVIAAIGFWIFLKNSIPGYLFFRMAFGILDYEKAAGFVLLENVLMLLFWVFAGWQIMILLQRSVNQEKKKKRMLSVVYIGAVVFIGFLLNIAVKPQDSRFGNASGWHHHMETGGEKKRDGQKQRSRTRQKNGNASGQSDVSGNAADDGYILINGGSFQMGSPSSENWRLEDETQHEVSVSSFYVSPYETDQKEYESLMGDNPSAFQGEHLPVENISWLDAVKFANAKSKEAGLKEAYTIASDSVLWDRSAAGYRLPTETEWEYACRAGTTTPFNMKKSPDAEDANFYGHYPYEIEENYFDDSTLETKPGEYRETTVKTGSFQPNQWGLYDLHGNVNEWCFDYYGEYDVNDRDNPVGAPSGTRHVYRGGGWNDFAKNMRSAYRAAGPSDMQSYNLGVRLVRNADAGISGEVAVKEEAHLLKEDGKVLIAYFSWGGNTRGIAKEIQRQTGADVFEIKPSEPYSDDYDTVLMEAQEDQHQQKRPKLAGQVEHMEQYRTILLGYPNWWASIPMPVASFLEEYDFKSKRIIPFCSHGGGRFGQSLTAIAKMAPDAELGEGLSVHYSGGNDLPEEIKSWLAANQIE